FLPRTAVGMPSKTSEASSFESCERSATGVAVAGGDGDGVAVAGAVEEAATDAVRGGAEEAAARAVAEFDEPPPQAPMRATRASAGAAAASRRRIRVQPGIVAPPSPPGSEAAEAACPRAVRARSAA